MRRSLIVLGVVLSASTVLMHAGTPPASAKLDLALQQRALNPQGVSRVILRTSATAIVDGILQRAGGTLIRTLRAQELVAVVPDASLDSLADECEILRVSLDRIVSGSGLQAPGSKTRGTGSGPQAPGSGTEPDISSSPTSSFIEGAASATEFDGQLGNVSTAAPPPQTVRGVPEPGARSPEPFDGTGVGIATIDSGMSTSHEDLSAVRVVHWADMVNHLGSPYDDYGHGTHVAGILAGAGVDAAGARRGIAPGADLTVIKALNANGSAHVSDVITALDYVVDNRARFNIRVINLSVAAGVYESYRTDPLTLAALRAVNAGIVVVAAAGNAGLSPAGEPQYGSITAPGNAPWVVTVGASDDRGTADPEDDEVAAFSSRGPSAIDGTSKPDLVASGVAVTSTADASSTLFALQPRARLWGASRTPGQPYLRLSGTSMAVPSVTGLVALMLQANPALTPNAVKAILEFTASPSAAADEASQGAGILNVRGALAVARQFANQAHDSAALDQSTAGTEHWGRRIIWGTRRISSVTLDPHAAAWQPGVLWGSETNAAGQPMRWTPPCTPGSAQCGGL